MASYAHRPAARSMLADSAGQLLLFLAHQPPAPRALHNGSTESVFPRLRAPQILMGQPGRYALQWRALHGHVQRPIISPTLARHRDILW